MLDFSTLRPLTSDLPSIVILSSLDYGGAGIAALRLHQGLLAAGADVKMVVIRQQSEEAMVGELNFNGAPLWNHAAAGWAKAIQDYPARPAGLELFSTVEAPFNVAELDVVKNAALVNLHWCAGMLSWPQAGANLRGKPLVWTLHDMNPFTGGCHYTGNCDKWRQGGCAACSQLGPSQSGGDLAAAGFKAKQDGYAGLDLHIVTPSRWLSDCAGQSILFDKFPRTVIPNGFPLDALRPCDRGAARKALDLPTNRKIILFGADACGNRRKGLHLLLAALPRLAERWQGEPPILATFGISSGMPAMPPGFEYRALGKLNGNMTLATAYSAADVFVLPSTEDNLPNTIIEAQACGTPSVGFAIGGLPDIVANSHLGRLAQPFDTADLADKIIEVLQVSPEEAAAFREECRAHAENAYNPYMQTLTYLRLYRRLLGLPEIQLANVSVPAAAIPANPAIPAGDYAAPELRYVDADPFFPYKIIGDSRVSNWPWLRKEIPHNWYVDRRIPNVGFLSRDEAILLHNAALPFAGENTLEIGCFMGWSACHLALAGVKLDVIDPLLARDTWMDSVNASLTAAGVRDRVNLIIGTSPSMVDQLCATGKRWKFIFIDGDHEAPAPRLDAEVCEKYAPTDALVMFHDVAAPAVADGVRYFRDKGWNVRIYHTAQIMAAAWRGDVPVPRHAPDPNVAWTIPDHLADLAPLFEPTVSAVAPVVTIATPTNNADDDAFQRGQRLMEAGNYGEALKIFSALKAHRARHPNLDLFRGYCFLQTGQFFDGRQALLEELRYFPDNQNAKSLLMQVRERMRGDQEKELTRLGVNDEFRELFGHIEDYTMVGIPRLWSIYQLTRQVCEADVPGNFVECGVAGGGTSALIATVLHRYSRRLRQLFSFDTFSGMPTPTQEDYNAYSRQGADDSHWGTGTCAAPEDSLRRIAGKLGVLAHIVITKGLFADTLPGRKADIGEIAFLHMDGDWYQSTRDIIDNLYDLLRPGGAVQVDDFGAWAGCRKALEEYFARIGYAPELTKIDATGVSFPITETLTHAINAVFPATAATAESEATIATADDELAPIALFAYNRRDVVAKTIEALKANAEAPRTDLYIFADGAKPGHEQGVNEVRDYLRSISGFRSVRLICRERNLGLATNIIDGVTSIVESRNRVIVLEDDIFTSPYFLRYMNEALRLYADTPEVACISGYAYPIKEKMPDSYFICGTCCWGWGTWQRAWKLFNPDAQALYDSIRTRGAAADFDFGNCYPYMNMLKTNKKSWAIRWQASAFIHGRLCLYPGRSLVNNIGFGADATNCGVVSEDAPYQTEVAMEPVNLRRLAPVEDPRHRRAVGDFLRWAYDSLVYATNFACLPSGAAMLKLQAVIQNNGFSKDTYHRVAFILDKLIARDEDLENAHALRGFYRWQLGDRAAGEADVREELRRHPGNHLALDLLRQIEDAAKAKEATPVLAPSASGDDNLAPIVLFAYNRHDVTVKTIDALKANPEAARSDLYIFADGAKPGQEESVNVLRDYLRTVDGFRSVRLTCRERNLGLSANITDGVTQVIDAHGRAIVVEDDIFTSPHFLRYMNEALTLYADTPEVVCISGYAFPVKEKMPESYFIRGIGCWGWATWARAWKLFNPDAEALYNAVISQGLKDDLDFYGCYPYTNQIKGKSWDILWMASAFLQNKLCLFPGRSLVNNLGFGGNATHCEVVCEEAPCQTEVSTEPVSLQKITPQENPEHRRIIGEYLRWANNALVYANNFARLTGEQTLQAMPKYVFAHDDYHLAIFILDKLIQRGDGDLENAHSMRGFSRWQIGDHDGGMADMREELRRYPNNRLANDFMRLLANGAVPAAAMPAMAATEPPITDEFAPIVLFAYNRRDLVEKTVNALKANPEAAHSDLYVFADGAKPGQDEKVNVVREYLRVIDGFRSVHLTCRESNLGLAANVIDGVTTVVNAHGRVIVMEDDLVTSTHFLRYMNEALTMYADTPEVACISGYAYPVNEKMPDSYFIRDICSLGWATWKRAWKLFNPNAKALYDAIVARNAIRDFDFDNCYPYTRMLKDNKNSWAIRWLASVYLHDMLCLYPSHSLVNHIGFGIDSTNCAACSNGDPYQTEVSKEPIPLQKIAPTENPKHRCIIGEFRRWAYNTLVYVANFERMPGAQVLQQLPKRVFASGNYHLAALILDKLIERGDGDLENVYALRGFSRWQLGDRAGGEADMREELRRHPDNSMALDLLRQIEANA